MLHSPVEAFSEVGCIHLKNSERPCIIFLCRLWILFLESDGKGKSLSRVWLFATPWTVAYQFSPSMGFSRQEYWSGLPFPSPGDLSDPGIEPGSTRTGGRRFNLWATREAPFLRVVASNLFRILINLFSKMGLLTRQNMWTLDYSCTHLNTLCLLCMVEYVFWKYFNINFSGNHFLQGYQDIFGKV